MWYIFSQMAQVSFSYLPAVRQEQEKEAVSAGGPDSGIHEMFVNYHKPLDREVADIYLRGLKALGLPARRQEEKAGLLFFDIGEHLTPEARDYVEKLNIDILNAVRQGLGAQLRQRLDEIENPQPRRLPESDDLFSP